ncbi:hypothetical protein IWX90DRAFT_419425 [Phyllosticta citrichinensis]|uniref:Uncharacterized protein n=1 Tax=Phyllosticta citrichinensis TaxID=1130410 RepID=A0ABR1XF01_9PEZI
MSASQQHPSASEAPHDSSKYIAMNWTTPSGKAHTIKAIPKAVLMHFSPGIRQLLAQLSTNCNVQALNFGVVPLDLNAAGFVLGQLRWSMTTGTPLDFDCRDNNSLERRLQTYKAMQVLDIFPFHKTLHKTLLNEVYRMTPSVAVIREICTNHVDDWGFTRSLLANVALQVSLGSCRGDVWDFFQDAIANVQDGLLEERFQAAVMTVKNNKNRAQRRTFEVRQSEAVPRLAQKPLHEPSQVTETKDVERFLCAENALFDDDE